MAVRTLTGFTADSDTAGTVQRLRTLAEHAARNPATAAREAVD